MKRRELRYEPDEDPGEISPAVAAAAKWILETPPGELPDPLIPALRKRFGLQLEEALLAIALAGIAGVEIAQRDREEAAARRRDRELGRGEP